MERNKEHTHHQTHGLETEAGIEVFVNGIAEILHDESVGLRRAHARRKADLMVEFPPE